MSERRQFQPVRMEKFAFHQRHVSAAMKRAFQQTKDIPWPKVTVREVVEARELVKK